MRITKNFESNYIIGQRGRFHPPVFFFDRKTVRGWTENRADATQFTGLQNAKSVAAGIVPFRRHKLFVLRAK
ncbi:MAG: hypothetical protein KGJ13_05020 [Patescibacteria group bacterium]|nr:hypothetical protein [Patescibacteria group bacterium]